MNFFKKKNVSNSILEDSKTCRDCKWLETSEELNEETKEVEEALWCKKFEE